MTAKIYCRTTAKGVHSFYMVANGESHFLFHQNYRRGVNKYYREGVRLDEALKISRAKGDNAVLRTMEKLPSYIKYVEREQGIEVLRMTAKRNARYKRSVA